MNCQQPALDGSGATTKIDKIVSKIFSNLRISSRAKRERFFLKKNINS
jgi:hypothetical protein